MDHLNTPSLQRELGAGLCTFGKLIAFLALQGGDLNLAAQGRFRKGYGNLAENIVAASCEDGMNTV